MVQGWSRQALSGPEVLGTDASAEPLYSVHLKRAHRGYRPGGVVMNDANSSYLIEETIDTNSFCIQMKPQSYSLISLDWNYCFFSSPFLFFSCYAYKLRAGWKKINLVSSFLSSLAMWCPAPPRQVSCLHSPLKNWADVSWNWCWVRDWFSAWAGMALIGLVPPRRAFFKAVAEEHKRFYDKRDRKRGAVFSFRWGI